jgi:hypothetical protein
MGFNRRKIEADRKAKADTEAASRRATDAQVLEDAERLIDAWNERQAKRRSDVPSSPPPTQNAARERESLFAKIFKSLLQQNRPGTDSCSATIILRGGPNPDL